MKNNKEIKNENEDTLAAMGIGAMIVFIALILVAAVASAVIIQTAEKLQQNAQTTGDQTQQQMASKVMPLSVIIDGGNLRMTWELAPGSDSIAFNLIAWSITCAAATPDAGHLGTSAAVSTNGGAGPALAGQQYQVTLTLASCPATANQNHYLTLAAGNAGFTYEVLSYGSSVATGSVVV
tara:strand:- start:16 stop:555 length:540 start_codon:yes stop_codon:yes gene_type:complete